MSAILKTCSTTKDQGRGKLILLTCVKDEHTFFQRKKGKLSLTRQKISCCIL